MYKAYSDSYLMTKSKKTLIEYLRIAEHNHRVCEETIDQQYKNFMELLKKERADAEPKWISVDERWLPNKGEVLVCTERGNIYISIVGGCFWVSHMDCRFGEEKITHWMPLPKPPQNT